MIVPLALAGILIVGLTLALGIGVNTSMFSLVDVLLFKAAPFPQGDRIFQIRCDTHQGPRTSFSESALRELRAARAV